MTLEESLHEQLLRSPHITAMAGPRIWHGRLPPDSFQSGSTRPALTYWRWTRRRSVTPIIESRGGELRVQLDCWAKTDTDVRALRDAVRLALHGFHGLPGGGVAVSNIAFENNRDMFERNTGIYHIAMDFLFIFDAEKQVGSGSSGEQVPGELRRVHGTGLGKGPS